MAVAFTVTDVAGSVPFEGVGQHRERIVSVVASGTYTTGGDALSAATLGFTKITSFMADPAMTITPTAFLPKYDVASGLLVLFQKSSGTGALIQAGSGDTIAASFTARVTGF